MRCCGDGDLMEGVSHEAASLAGTLGLGKLIFLYDDNLISLDGPTELSYTDDVSEALRGLPLARAAAWTTATTWRPLKRQSTAAKAETSKPSLIAVRTVIGYGSPKAGTNKVHGEALGAADMAATKKFFGFPEDQSFYVPDDALANWRKAVDRGAALEAEWKKLFAGYAAAYPELAAEFERTQKGELQGGLGEGDSQLPGGQAGGHAQRGRRGDERDCRGGAGAVWRRGRPDRLDQDDLQAGRELPRRSRGAQRVLRRARVRHVRGGERNGRARRADSVRLDLLLSSPTTASRRCAWPR